MLEKTRKIFIGISCLIAVFLFALLINIIQFTTLLLLPLSKKIYRIINSKAIGAWWLFCVFILRKIVGIKLVVSGDMALDSRNGVVLANHQCWADICIVAFFACKNKMAGKQRWLIKDVLKYVPGIGWGLLFSESIFLKRNWHSDKNLVFNIFSKYIRENIPFWVMCFAEGTRRTQIKHARSMKYAERMGLTKTDHVMIPRKKGFVSAVNILRDKISFIVDITIAYPKIPKSIITFFCGECLTVYCHIRKFDIKELPYDEDKLGNWLIKLYVEKDGLLKQFYHEGKFADSKIS